MYQSRRAREQIIAAEMRKLERRQAAERSRRTAARDARDAASRTAPAHRNPTAASNARHA